jgi:glutathione synthase/RimK-type ligase-like ATP-grasp enzyme
MAYKVFPYKQGSRSAHALANALGGRVLRRRGSTYRQRPQDLIINWGAGSPFRNGRILNEPARIEAASNKLTCFRALQNAGVNIPPFWTRQQDIPDDAFPVVCRTLLTASEGRGIVIANNRRELVNAPLYTKYIKKQDEYRIHVGRDHLPYGNPVVISQQRKARRNGQEANFQVRNLANGFVFVRDGVNPPRDVVEQAKAALVASGLQFGAVDVIYNRRQGRAYVLEINTAPGLEGRTIEDYANAFRRL